MNISLAIVLITVIVSILAFNNRSLFSRLLFNPSKVKKNSEFHRFITSGFIHADWMHLLINMFVLYSFGPIVEQYYHSYFGSDYGNYFLLLYAGGLVMSILPTYRKQFHNPGYNALGASGAVSGVVFAFILFQPLEKICLYGILCLPGVIFGAAYLFYCIYMDRKGGSRINHDAHLWGAIYGIVFTSLLQPSLLMDFFGKLIYFRNVI
jgi:membrane associated rhomboid family serine protease